MLSILTVLSIFVEIFTAGILLAGVESFIRRVWERRDWKDLYLGLTFLFFAFFVLGTLASQMMFNVGRSIAELSFVQKINAASLIFGALFAWFYLAERFSLRLRRILDTFFTIFALLLVLQVVTSALNLVYRMGVIQPVVIFSRPTPINTFWVVVWVIFSLGYLFLARRAKNKGEKSVLRLSGFSGGLVAVAYLCFIGYSFFGAASFLLSSWILNLVAVGGLFLGHVIPPDSPLAHQPLNYFRSRILYRLLLIFVVLIILLIEGTALVNISLGKESLFRSTVATYEIIAANVGEKVELMTKGIDAEKVDLKEIQDLIRRTKVGNKGFAYVVSREGKILAHPDFKRAAAREDLSGITIVDEAAAGREVHGEFYDEWGEKMVGAVAIVRNLGWGVIIQEPVWDAYFEMRRLETGSLFFVFVGIFFAVGAGVFFARGVENSIRKVITGTEAVRAGDLNYHISIPNLDEIGQLAQAFNQMTVDLRESQAHLIMSEKLAALGTMAAGMAHEIKNPLVSLRTFTQLLPVKYNDPEFIKKFSTIVPQEIERINKIAESLLRFGRPARPEFKPLNVNNILNEVLGLLENQCKKGNVKINKKFGDVPEIIGDPGQLSQAFLNLCLNAVQSMHGGGELTIESDVGEVVQLVEVVTKGPLMEAQIKEKEEKGKKVIEEEKPPETRIIPVVFVEITDTGVGIPEESLKSLFDPFFTTKTGGTGMGLPITLRIIEDHGGSIKVKSTIGKGTTFTIIIPQKKIEGQ